MARVSAILLCLAGLCAAAETPVPRLHLAPEQTVDVLAEANLRFTLDHSLGRSPAQVTLEAQRRSVTLTCRAGERYESLLALPDIDTRRQGTHRVPYTLSADGRTLATGVVRLRVADPLEYERQAEVHGDGTVGVRLRNTSAKTTYRLESVAWKIGDHQTGAAVLDALPPRRALAVRLPAPWLRPFQTYPLMVSVQLKDREPIALTAEVSDKPVQHLADTGLRGVCSIALGADTTWRRGRAGAEAADGSVALLWDQDHLILLATVCDGAHRPPPARGRDALAGDSLTVAVAPAGAKAETGRHEFRLALAPDGTQMRRTIAPDPSDVGPVPDARAKVWHEMGLTRYEVAIPWDVLRPIRPADGAMRVAFLVIDDDGDAGRQLIGWGRGVGPDTAPLRMHLCRLAKAGERRPHAPVFRAAIEPLEP